MGRAFIVILAALSLVIVACNAPTGGASPTPTNTADIHRSKLDIAYSAFVDQDVHHVTSRKALEAALDAAKTEIKAEGGNADAATPSFQDTEDPQTADFNKFAQAIAGMTATISQPSADKIADAAISGQETFGSLSSATIAARCRRRSSMLPIVGGPALPGSPVRI